MSSLLNIPFERMDGSTTSLNEFKGKVVMIVNVASKCGLTPQYEGLEKLYREFNKEDFVILGFPANNFLAQEPGSNEEIEKFCKLSYDVTFPVLSKISVKGEDKHPLYSALLAISPKAKGPDGSSLSSKLESLGQTPDSPTGILWNFEKFLIDRDGNVAARFSPDMTPDSPVVKETIAALIKKAK